MANMFLLVDYVLLLLAGGTYSLLLVPYAPHSLIGGTYSFY